MKKAVVIFSGGQDSTTCLFWALNRAEEVEAISFAYGQKHSIELEQARKICSDHGVKHTVVDISFLDQIVESALISNGDVNVLNEKGLPSSFVPNRNQLFITLAHAFAQKIKADTLVTGVCQTDYSGYFDCRQIFVKQLEAACNLGSNGHNLTPAWIAGFIEGDGWFSRGNYKTKDGVKYYPEVGIQQNDLGILQQIQSFFGCGNICENKPSDLSKNASWTLTLSYRKAQYAYNLMMKHGSQAGRKARQFTSWVNEHQEYLEKDNKGDISQNMANVQLITIETPLMYLNKADTFKLAQTENCLGVVLNDSHTCYNGDRETHNAWGFGCGTCPACELRAKGFTEAFGEGGSF